MSNQKPIVIVADAISEFIRGVKEVLNAPEHATILLSVTSDLTKVENRLRFISGSPQKAVEKPTTDPFPPITHFMGQKIKRVGMVKVDDLSPKDAERQSFRNRVDTLYAQFDSLSYQGILNSHTNKEDVLVLRGVAKRAGVENYETAEITRAFLEDISYGIEEKEGEAAEQDRIEKDLQKQAEITALNERIAQVKLKRETLPDDLIAAEAELAAAPDNKKMQKKVAGIKEEIAAAENLQNELGDSLATLTA